MKEDSFYGGIISSSQSFRTYNCKLWGAFLVIKSFFGIVDKKVEHL